ncbi:MAG: PadR family transcriptional regulator [Anaerolineaceae bacterium]|jgi:DNA-binding PadR family transcriptional regulator
MEDDELLQKWEETYKKGLLSLWILLLLAERPSYPFEMRPLLEEISQGMMSADDNSIYRALARFQDMGLTDSDTQPSKQGPYRRYYHLTDKGRLLLKRFIERNILIFSVPAVAARIHANCSEPSLEENNHET